MGKKTLDCTIRFKASVEQIKTMVDGGIRITLDMAETETQTAMELMEFRRKAVMLSIVAKPIEIDRTDI